VSAFSLFYSLGASDARRRQAEREQLDVPLK
jgi:hypothetical protein